jgi:hypothetical protein
MQGFFVHVTNGTYPVTGQLIVNNNARILNPTVVFFGLPGQQSPPPLFRLSVGFAGETIAADPVVFYFNGAATGAFNEKLDALKLINTDSGIPSLYAVSTDSKKLSINAMPAPYDSAIVPLGLITQKQEWLTFHAGDMGDIPARLYVYLYDALTGVSHDLRQNPLYRIYLASGEYENRFYLKFTTKEQIAINALPNESFKAYSSGGKLFVNGGLAPGERGNLAVVNMLGQVIFRQEISGNSYQAINSTFATGIYLVNLSTPNGIQAKKLFIADR